MGQKIVVGPISKGLRNDVLPFNVDNDAFPTLRNAYQWRQRVKRKRGTQFFGRLTRYFDSTSTAFNPGTTTQAMVAGAGNILTGFTSSGIQTNATVFPGSVTINNVTVAQAYTDPGAVGVLVGSLGGSGTINYSTGDFTISGGAGNTVNANFKYYPNLPVLGLEPFVQDASDYPIELGFDQTYSYNMSLVNSGNVNLPYVIHNVSFYYNVASNTYTDGANPNVQKGTWVPVKWNMADYQQVWTTNYQGALWAVPGIASPFSAASTSIGMQFVLNGTIAYVSATQINITYATAVPVIGDFVFLNEITTNSTVNAAAKLNSVNFQTGYVTALAAGIATITFPNGAIINPATGDPGMTYSGGITQLLTNNSNTAKDCIRWYNGAPVNSDIPPSFSTNKGWVNFAPPIISGVNNIFTVADLPPAQYYLVGARMVVPFKDRLLFFGPVVQAKTGDPKYLQDTIIYSQNGTPYYTASFNGDPVLPTTQFNPILVPTNQTSSAASFFEDVFGFGGYITAGYARPITTVSVNEDALIVGFADRQTRVLYTGNDIVPFNFYVINSELGSDSTFSSITLDRGVITLGGRGFVLTSQTATTRIDLPIPDKAFQLNLLEAGARRVCAQRDFINEWIYFTYPTDTDGTKFPSETLQYNYRDETWALHKESYTTYGTVRLQLSTTGYSSWATLPPSLTWNEWHDPWNSGISTPLQPLVIAGNTQGFVMIRTGNTDEEPSLYIKSFASASSLVSPNHCLLDEYVVITGCLGTIGQQLNGKIFNVNRTSSDNLTIDPPIAVGTYLGGGRMTRIYSPYIQTRQFPVAWDSARKTRLGPQQYLFTKTDNSQITLLIFLSQDSSNAYNDSPIVPSPESENNSLVYSTVLYTCPESENIGLTAANTNLQMPTASTQRVIWHRMNTSLIGDTVQIGFTLSEDQLKTLSTYGDEFAITGATQANPCVLTCAAGFQALSMIKITGVLGMTQLNYIDPVGSVGGNYYQVISSNSTTVTINIDSTAFGAFTTSPDAVAQKVIARDQFSEIEMHGMILDVTPSQVLA